METPCAGNEWLCTGFDTLKATNLMVMLSLMYWHKGKFSEYKRVTCIPALTYVLFLNQDAWRSHCKAQEGEPFAARYEHTHTIEAAPIPGQDHTLLPHGTGSHYALYAACVPSDWKWHARKLSMEKLYVSKLCIALYPLACLPALAFHLKDGKVTTVLSRKDAVDHCDRHF